MRRRALTTSHGVPGAIGSAVLSIGALALGWLPPLFHVDRVAVLALLRTTVVGESLGRMAVLVGGALVLQSWLVLGTDVLRRRALEVRQLQRILALWLIPTLLVPPLFSRDMYSYFVQGRLLAAGLDPYTHGVASVPGWFQAGVDPMWAETPTPYGPLSLLLQRVIVGTAATPYWSAVCFRFLAIAGVALIAIMVPRLAEHHGIDPAAAFWLAAMNPLVLLHFSFGGHNDALMVGLMLAGFEAAVKRRPIPSILWLAAAVAVKPIALVAVPFAALAVLDRRAGLTRRLVAYAVSGLAVLAPVVALGAVMGVGTGWVQALTTPGSVRTWLSPSTALGMTIGLIGNLAGNRDVDAIAVTAMRAAAMLLAVILCLVLLLRPQGRSPMRGALLAFTAIVGLGPVVQPWYLLWALPIVAVTGMHRPWHLRATVLGTAGFVIYALAEPTATADSHLTLFDSLGMVLAGATVLLVLLASPRERALAIGDQFAAGLTPRDPSAVSRAEAQVTR